MINLNTIKNKMSVVVAQPLFFVFAFCQWLPDIYVCQKSKARNQKIPAGYNTTMETTHIHTHSIYILRKRANEQKLFSSILILLPLPADKNLFLPWANP